MIIIELITYISKWWRFFLTQQLIFLNKKYCYNNNILLLHFVKQKSIVNLKYKLKFRLLIFLFKMIKDNIIVGGGKI